jgi:hypothetical protein
MPFTVIRVFEIDDYDTTMFMQMVDIGDLYSDEFKQELENKNLDWEEYYG